MKKITVELTNLEAEAMCFALGATAKDLNDLIQGCFNNPCPDGETPEHRLNLMNNFLRYEIALPSTIAGGNKVVFDVTPNNDKAGVKLYVAAAADFAKDTWTDYNNTKTEAIDGWGTFYLKAVVTSEDKSETETAIIKVVVTPAETLTFSITGARVVINGKTVKDTDTLDVAVGATVTMQVTFADDSAAKIVKYGDNAVTGFSGVYEFDVAAGTTAVTVTNVAP